MTSKFFINMSHISDSKIGESFVRETYDLIASSNTSLRSPCRLYRSLCTVTFWQKVDFLISNAHQNSRLYGLYFVVCHNDEHSKIGHNYRFFFSNITVAMIRLESWPPFTNPTIALLDFAPFCLLLLKPRSHL